MTRQSGSAVCAFGDWRTAAWFVDHASPGGVWVCSLADLGASIGRRLNAILAWTMEAGGMVACGGWRLPGVWSFTRSTPLLSSRSSSWFSIC